MQIIPALSNAETADFTSLTLKLLDGNNNIVTSANADNEGNIAVESVPDGEYTVVAAMPGYAPRKIPVTVKNGTPVDLGEIKLCKYGDATGDGDVNMRDLARIQQKLSKWDVDYVYDETADVTGDGEVNMRDLARLQQWLSKWKVVLGK